MKLAVDENGCDLVYYIDGDVTNNTSRNKFVFQFLKATSDTDRDLNSQNYIEPYIYGWDGTRDGLFDKNHRGCYKGCTSCNLCTKLIQLNSWKIPSDYPW